MQKTKPIRRYVLLRHRDQGVPAPRWSMERIAGSPGDASARSGSPAAGSPDSRR